MFLAVAAILVVAVTARAEISLDVRDANESRYRTINAGLYHREGYLITKVADLTRGRSDDFGRNEWRAPENTYIEPDADYYFLLNCSAGYANDDVAQFATTYSFREDSESREGWSLHDYLGLRIAGSTKWERDSNKTLRIRIKGRPSPDRAYNTEIISTPVDGHTYRYGENIDIALTFNTDVYAPEDDSWIVIRVGDAASGPNTRVAEYLSGSDTNRLIYRYQVEFDDADANGISVDGGGSDTGFVGSVPTIVASSGLLPVERYFPGVADDPIHKVDGSLRGAVGMSRLPTRLARPLVWPAKWQAKRLFIRPERHHIGNLLKLGEGIRRQRPCFNRAHILFHFLYRACSHQDRGDLRGCYHHAERSLWKRQFDFIQKCVKLLKLFLARRAQPWCPGFYFGVASR